MKRPLVSSLQILTYSLFTRTFTSHGSYVIIQFERASINKLKSIKHTEQGGVAVTVEKHFGSNLGRKPGNPDWGPSWFLCTASQIPTQRHDQAMSASFRILSNLFSISHPNIRRCIVLILTASQSRIEQVKLYTRIQGVLGSNLGRDSNYPEVFRELPPPLHPNTGIVPGLSHGRSPHNPFQFFNHIKLNKRQKTCTMHGML